MKLEPAIADDHHARARRQRELAAQIAGLDTGTAETGR
ncbi:hypothetical protein P3T27_007650 [Kitasatospora sp. MAA19]|nr:hypothetical protein [Kitasatospora sp. MAA19]